MADRTYPPKAAFRLIRSICDDRWVEEIEGDLIEYYELYCQRNPGWKVRIFFWFHLASFLRPYTLKKRQNSKLKFLDHVLRLSIICLALPL